VETPTLIRLIDIISDEGDQLYNLCLTGVDRLSLQNIVTEMIRYPRSLLNYSCLKLKRNIPILDRVIGIVRRKI
jgi:hypothetical protein